MVSDRRDDVAGFDDLGIGGKVKDLAIHLFLPCAGLAVAMLPPLVRHVRSAMIEVLESLLIRAARGHGISERARAAIVMRCRLPPIL